jgi:hypothetical protein
LIGTQSSTRHVRFGRRTNRSLLWGGTAVLGIPNSRVLGIVVFVGALCVPFAPHAQGLGELAGIVTSEGALPGVKVTVATRDFERSAVTDSDGRYRIDLPAGTYVVRAELPGFEAGIQNGIAVTAGGTTILHFALGLGCIWEPVRVDLGLAFALRQATAIFQIRILESGSGQRCSATGSCVCTEHVAGVTRVLRAAAPDDALTTIRFLQEGAGRILDERKSGVETPYVPGQEYIAFLQWDPDSIRFLRVNGPTYMFPVRNGRVEFKRDDLPGVSDGTTVEAFTRALRAASKSPR